MTTIKPTIKTETMGKTKRTQDAKDFSKMKDTQAHILKRPDMYIGSREHVTTAMWVFNDKAAEGESQLAYETMTYIPGLYKLFDELLVNTRDHVMRCRDKGLELCTMIRITIDQETGTFTFWNNGASIPITKDEEHDIYIPSMIFGDLYSGSNYDDDEKRKVGGMNGLGAKLCNVLSKQFIIECVDTERHRKFYQEFSDNMYKKTKPSVTACKSKKSYTKITMVPDLARFSLEKINSAFIALFKKRVHDIAVTDGIKVYYNEELVAHNTFAKYIDLYVPDNTDRIKVVDVSDPMWRVGVVYDPADKHGHQVISFVNGINTTDGGTHETHVINKLVEKLQEQVAKKLKGVKVKPAMIKENLTFFIDSQIDNPSFNSQTKEKHTTAVAKFGSTYSPPQLFINKVLKCGVVDQIVANANAREAAKLMTTGKNKGSNMSQYPKLYDAHRAKLKKGDCTLILTEGDSAKTMAMSGLNVIGRSNYGVFPLKGKLLNTREASPKTIMENDEIMAVIDIIGLTHKKAYTTTDGLRYGSILILTDQDVDGSHIKGLIMNFVHYFWPSLIKFEGFVRALSTPLVKVTKGKGRAMQKVEFFSLQEFTEWLKANNQGKGWDINYYKGLGTSTAKEAQECFTDLEQKLVSYFWLKDVAKVTASKASKKTKGKTIKAKKSKTIEIESEFIDADSDAVTGAYKPKSIDVTEDAITLAFEKKRADDRKTWISNADANAFLDNTKKRISYYDFIHTELRAFSVYSVERAVPNLMDGFKPGQRKIYSSALKRNLCKPIKVAQFAGYVSEHMHYHHGDQSLLEAIIKMAQNYVGSNNINVLEPHGQFGSRISGGKDAASPRYILTCLNELGRKIFIGDDHEVLTHQFDDGDQIEPVFYGPIIPMILVNGADGIGTGYSTRIEPCNPRDIIANIRRIIAGSKPRTMKPWYRDFTGTVEKVDDGKYVIRARYEITGDVLHIQDLPIGTWTDNYKAFIAKLAETPKGKGKRSGQSASTHGKGKGTSSPTSPTKSPARKPLVAGSKGAARAKFLADKSKSSGTAKVAKTNHIGTDIKSYIENCTDTHISFTLTFHPGKLNTYVKNGTLDKLLKLVTAVDLNNMWLFDENRHIQKYTSYAGILHKFAEVRIELYQKRKDHLLGKWRREIDVLRWKLKFVENVVDDVIIVSKKTGAQVKAQLEEHGYPKFALRKDEVKPSYNYLTSMTILQLTSDEIAKLRKQIKDKQKEIATLEAKTPAMIWSEELDELEVEYDKWDAECIRLRDELAYSTKGKKPAAKPKAKAKPAPKRAAK
ncbi:DNA topoisomerase 2 [uncultured virus]|nr:DNA topoisomerase 2 [uncultured virus]